jgi:hypothetical protein
MMCRRRPTSSCQSASSGRSRPPWQKAPVSNPDPWCVKRYGLDETGCGDAQAQAALDAQLSAIVRIAGMSEGPREQRAGKTGKNRGGQPASMPTGRLGMLPCALASLTTASRCESTSSTVMV